MAFMLTRVNVGNYDAWKPMFDEDAPGVRKAAKGWRLLRGAEDPNEVGILVEFDSTQDAQAGREKLLASGVLERVEVKAAPTIFEQAEEAGY